MLGGNIHVQKNINNNREDANTSTQNTLTYGKRVAKSPATRKIGNRGFTAEEKGANEDAHCIIPYNRGEHGCRIH